MKTLNITQIIDTIASVGEHVTVLVQGELGTGKSSILKALADKYPDHHAAYFDITTRDVGDFMLPSLGDGVAQFLPNSELGFHTGKPVLLMLDEIGKASKIVMNACLRLMLERKMGEYALPPGSIVFATSNLSVEGLGDNIPAHARNRITTLKMRKPTAPEWAEWAINNDIEPVVIGTALEFPMMLDTYENYDRPELNPYVNDPRTVRTAFVTPRSLEKASHVVRHCKILGDEILTQTLIGTIGERAALDMVAMIKLDMDLPMWSDVIAAPLSTPIPQSAAAACMLIAKACMKVNKDNVDAWMQYLSRMSAEAQGLFCRLVTRNQSPTRTMIVNNKAFTELVVAKQYLW